MSQQKFVSQAKSKFDPRKQGEKIRILSDPPVFLKTSKAYETTVFETRGALFVSALVRYWTRRREEVNANMA